MENLNCPVCTEQYDTGQRTPKLMPCLHTVCASCLINLNTCDSLKTRHTIGGSSTPTKPDGRPRIITGKIPNSKAISNLASILQANRPLPLQHTTEDKHETSEDSPPALPKRNAVLIAPPLKPKPPTLSTPELRRPASEPDIPRNVVFHCPVCLTVLESSFLQTNRYVLAHLRDLERLGQTEQPLPNLPVPAERNLIPENTEGGGIVFVPNLSNSRHDKRNSFVPENFWCISCAKPCGDDCDNHEHQPIEEYIQKATLSLRDMLNGVEERLVDHVKNQEATNEDFKVIFRALTKASRHLWTRNESTKEIGDSLVALKDSIDNKDDSKTHSQLALDLTAKVQNLRQLDEKLSSLETGTDSNEIYLLHQNNKLFISTSDPDKTIIITISDSSQVNDL
ncbi:uncharacterized protein [Palaemon carinicauda]|uniref:uncharacterized protein n=1 Tax=Palaemon carinicauda TaxID=392227 RepID=UPI0035B6A621